MWRKRPKSGFSTHFSLIPLGAIKTSDIARVLIEPYWPDFYFVEIPVCTRMRVRVHDRMRVRSIYHARVRVYYLRTRAHRLTPFAIISLRSLIAHSVRLSLLTRFAQTPRTLRYGLDNLSYGKNIYTYATLGRECGAPLPSVNIACLSKIPNIEFLAREFDDRDFQSKVFL